MILAKRKSPRVLLSLMCIVLILALMMVVLVYSSNVVQAQQKIMSIELRLEQLNSELQAGNLMIGFQFIAPISLEENYWLFGNPDNEDSLSITEIAADHFCFSQTSYQAVLIRCVPYTNIASIDYLGI